jgi:hypothetical protein
MTDGHEDKASGMNGYLTILPMRLDKGFTVTHQVVVPSPWGGPLLMGSLGVDVAGEPTLIIVNETPVNFIRPSQPLDTPDKWALEMIHLQRAAVDARYATGQELFRAIDKGADPPDAVVDTGNEKYGWELTTLTVEGRRQARDLFNNVRAKLAMQQRHRVSHLAGHLTYMWFGMAAEKAGLPYRRNDATAVDELLDALATYKPDPSHYTADVQGGPPPQLPGGYDSVNAPGDVALFSTPFLNGVPTSPLFSLTGVEIGLAYQSNHSASREWSKLRDLINKKDRPENNVLLISVGAPDRVGNQYPAEEVLANFLLDNPEPVTANHLSAVLLHFWGTGRAMNLLGAAPTEAWPAVYQGNMPSSQLFRPTPPTQDPGPSTSQDPSASDD